MPIKKFQAKFFIVIFQWFFWGGAMVGFIKMIKQGRSVGKMTTFYTF